MALLSLAHLPLLLAGATAGCSPQPQGRQNSCSLMISCPSEWKSCRGLTYLPVSPVFFLSGAVGVNEFHSVEPWGQAEGSACSRAILSRWLQLSCASPGAAVRLCQC